MVTFAPNRKECASAMARPGNPGEINPMGASGNRVL